VHLAACVQMSNNVRSTLMQRRLTHNVRTRTFLVSCLLHRPDTVSMHQDNDGPEPWGVAAASRIRPFGGRRSGCYACLSALGVGKQVIEPPVSQRTVLWPLSIVYGCFYFPNNILHCLTGFVDLYSTSTHQVHSACRIQMSIDICFLHLSLHPLCLDPRLRHSLTQHVHLRNAHLPSDRPDNSLCHNQAYPGPRGPPSNCQDKEEVTPQGMASSSRIQLFGRRRVDRNVLGVMLGVG
jgi:hypothetical protein